jgi:hypothetical protein
VDYREHSIRISVETFSSRELKVGSTNKEIFCNYGLSRTYLVVSKYPFLDIFFNYGMLENHKLRKPKKGYFATSYLGNYL